MEAINEIFGGFIAQRWSSVLIDRRSVEEMETTKIGDCRRDSSSQPQRFRVSLGLGLWANTSIYRSRKKSSPTPV